MRISEYPKLVLTSPIDVEVANEALRKAGDLRHGGTGEDYLPIEPQNGFPHYLNLQETRAVIEGLWKWGRNSLQEQEG